MTENPAAIARGARTIYQSLKELLKTKEPFDKELEFQRKNLRKRYLALLLLHPYAKESKDAENHLWMQTSYASISSYKECIAKIDRALQQSNNGSRPQAQQQQQGSPSRQRPPTGPVEHRKMLVRFRQFLSEEEKFWMQLVLRMYRSFELREAEPALAALGLVHDAEDAGRYSFPEEPATPLVPGTPAERESRLAILSKALICLGDIARYRELYHEGSGGRPARRGRGRGRGGGPAEAIPQSRVYDSAEQRYEQARLLVPHEGNPFHQLAILATYRKDTFDSVYYYYRALCVRQPYETAADNLATVLQKALDQWKRSRDRNVKDRVLLFKERLVVLHSLWRKGLDHNHERAVHEEFQELVAQRHLPIDMISHVVVMTQGALWKHRMIRDTGSRRQKEVQPTEPAIVTEWNILHHLLSVHLALLEAGREQLKDLPPMDAVNNDLAQRITAVFRRTLPALRIASKWLRANLKYLMCDIELQALRERGEEVKKSASEKLSSRSVHTIAFWRGYAQFVAALAQSFPVTELPVLAAPLEEDVDVKGFLPLKKMMADAFTARADGEARENPHPNEEQLMRISDLLADARALASAEHCPLIAFRNLNTMVFDESMVESQGEAAHGNTFQPIPPQQQQVMNNIRDRSAEQHHFRDEDAMTEATSRTDDDVLKAAFRHIGEEIEQLDDEDDEIVVYNPKGPALSPVLSPIMQPSLLVSGSALKPSNGYQAGVATAFPSPVLSKLSPKIGKTPIASPRTQTLHAITAQDLLNDVMNMGRGNVSTSGRFGTTAAGLVPPPSADSALPPLLFGSDLSHRPTTSSIWSAGRDEQSLKFGTAASPAHHQPPALQTSPHMYHTSQSHASTHLHGMGNGMGAAHDLNGTSIWSSSHPTSTQASQTYMDNALPNVAHGAHTHAQLHLGQRMPSSGPIGMHSQYSQSHHPDLGLNGGWSSTVAAPKPPQLQHRPSTHAGFPRQSDLSPSAVYYQQQPHQLIAPSPLAATHSFHQHHHNSQLSPSTIQGNRLAQSHTAPDLWGAMG